MSAVMIWHNHLDFQEDIKNAHGENRPQIKCAIEPYQWIPKALKEGEGHLQWFEKSHEKKVLTSLPPSLGKKTFSWNDVRNLEVCFLVFTQIDETAFLFIQKI